MRVLFIWLIRMYQLFVSPILHMVLGVKNICRYEVSCSQYAKEKIQQHGIVKGGALAVRRLLSCQPFGTIRQ